MKINYCFIGLTLLFSSVSMSLENREKVEFVNFYNLLDDQQKEKYEVIVRERLIIYVVGMVLGLGLGYYYYSKNKGEKYIVCKSIIIMYLIKLGFYYFFPKSPLMLYSLTTKEQTDAWADIYSEMKNRWKKSLIVGFLAYVILALSFMK